MRVGDGGHRWVEGRWIDGDPPAGVPGVPGGGIASGASGAAYAAALAGLPGAGPATLVAILQDWTPEEAWHRVREGRLKRPERRRPGVKRQLRLGLDHPGSGAHEPGAGSNDGVATPGASGPPLGPDETWRDVARRIDPPGWWMRHASRGVGVTWRGQSDYPAALVDDPEPPGVLFWRGSLRHLAEPCVAIVGTRRATPDGQSVAFELGRDLAAAGVCVVSGLALGIDGAAHTGALTTARPSGPAGAVGPGPAGPAGPAGVAASGVDVPYPRRHSRLWEQVIGAGVMLSETLPGRPAQAWRFPARNRIIAGLVSMVVVVESHSAGGSLITADAAIARGVEVRVVPGPVYSSASAGSNQLLYDGPGPVRSARDVLDGLGMFISTPQRPSGQMQAPSIPRDGPGKLGVEGRRVLDAVSWRPTSLNQVVARSGLPIALASRVLDSLEAAGLVSRDGQWWVPRRGGGPMS